MNKPITERQIEGLAQALRARKHILNELVHLELSNSTDQAHVELAGTVHDTKDESMASALRSVELRVVRLHLDELDDIANAEQRIAEGTFGQCLDCQADIGFPRLVAYPTAKRCLACQQAHEKQL